MNTHSKTSSILASVIAMILAVPGGAWADEGRYDKGEHDNGYQKKGHYNTRYNTRYNNHYNSYYKGGRYNYPRYYPCNTCGKNNNHHNNNNNDNDKLWIGLLGGGIVGYALGNYQQSNTYEQGYYPQAAPPPPQTVTQYETVYPGNTCLQQREYRSKIMVGGRQVDGYGTACLQPDGSWRYGPAQAAY
jgi:hypothetical protein